MASHSVTHLQVGLGQKPLGIDRCQSLEQALLLGRIPVP